jgi:hypothetical protein
VVQFGAVTPMRPSNQFTDDTSGLRMINHTTLAADAE